MSENSFPFAATQPSGAPDAGDEKPGGDRKPLLLVGAAVAAVALGLAAWLLLFSGGDEPVAEPPAAPAGTAAPPAPTDTATASSSEAPPSTTALRGQNPFKALYTPPTGLASNVAANNQDATAPATNPTPQPTSAPTAVPRTTAPRTNAPLTTPRTTQPRTTPPTKPPTRTALYTELRLLSVSEDGPQVRVQLNGRKMGPYRVRSVFGDTRGKFKVVDVLFDETGNPTVVFQFERRMPFNLEVGETHTERV